MKVGLAQKYIPLWRVLWMRLTGHWYSFLVYVEEQDHDPCPLCKAPPSRACDAGSHLRNGLYE